jgi:glycosyltransferase involved in cell wall biosynthesis
MSSKVLQITAAYKPAYVYGGPTMSVSKLCEALSQSSSTGLTVEVLTTTANGKRELNVNANEPQLVDGVRVTYFKRITKDHTHFSPALLTALRTILSANRKKNSHKLVIHIHAWWNLVSILSCQLAKWYKIPVVLSPRGMLTAYTLGNRNTGFKSLIHLAMGSALLKYCHVHATSEKEKRDVLQFLSPKSITVIPNLVDLPLQFIDRVKPQDTNRASFHLLFLSRIEEKKGLELLFDALKIVEIDWKLTIAGTGEENYITNLKAKIDELALTHRIEWLGHVSNENKFSLLAENDITVLTSYNENFANVVIESLSVGTPLLLSSEVGLASYVADHQLGWIASLTATDIKDKIVLAFNDHEKRAKIRKIAPGLIATNFMPSNLVKEYINLYDDIN